MTRDDILSMAREAGKTRWFGTYADGTSDFRGAEFDPEQLVRFAALVAAHEREECARVCEASAMKNEQACDGADADEAVSLCSAAWQMSNCAAAIRARGQQ